jgi:CRP/FNR family transcriptional regulator, cyclic AMP receptor protein
MPDGRGPDRDSVAGMADVDRQRVEFLELLEPEDREALRARGAVRRFRSGATLMYEGQAGEEVLLLLEGRVKVTSITAEGREIVLRFCGPGELLGELSVLEERPRSSTVEALESVEALAISGTDFRALAESRPSLALALFRMISHRFRDADRKRIEFGASHTLGRVAARLVELAERYGGLGEGGTVIDLPISQEELAGWTGSSREAVAKALQTLRQLGLITTERRRITVLDPEGLRRQSA